jgi:periplasmic protein TonB
VGTNKAGKEKGTLMFENVLLEKNHTIQNRRKWATLLSLVVELVIVGALVLIPAIVIQALPTPQLTTMLVAPPPPPPPPEPGAAVVKTTTSTAPVLRVNKVTLNALRTPTEIPKTIDMTPEAAAQAPPAVGGVVGGVSGGVPGGVLGGTVGGFLSGILNSGAILPPKPKTVRVSQGVSEGLLVHKVTPQYPFIAKQAHVQGSVTLTAIIGTNGKVDNVQLEHGSPLLASAAVNAVKQWRYKPYVLDGSPVEVETTVTVNFNLAA